MQNLTVVFLNSNVGGIIRLIGRFFPVHQIHTYCNPCEPQDDKSISAQPDGTSDEGST